MKSIPVSVWKYRDQENFKSLSKELGFSTTLPDFINIEKSSTELNIFTKTIEEYAFKGNLVRKLHVSYNTDELNRNPDTRFEIILSPDRDDNEFVENSNVLINKETVNLGLPVQRTREWAMRIHALDGEPEIARVTSWSWSDDSVYYSVSGDTSDEDLYQDFIRQIIISRQNL
ncbi:MAG: hypothetical protein JEZ04_18240 [Spirochaetales bacterium]|nr:hypothetical protein [Spirochaetales bacterium]